MVSGLRIASRRSVGGSEVTSDRDLVSPPSCQVRRDPSRSITCRFIEKGPETVMVSRDRSCRRHSKRAVLVSPSAVTANLPAAIQGLRSAGALATGGRAARCSTSGLTHPKDDAMAMIASVLLNCRWVSNLSASRQVMAGLHRVVLSPP